MEQMNVFDYTRPSMLPLSRLDEFVGRRLRRYISKDAVLKPEDAVDELVTVVSVRRSEEWTDVQLFNGKHGLFHISFNNAVDKSGLYDEGL